MTQIRMKGERKKRRQWRRHGGRRRGKHTEEKYKEEDGGNAASVGEAETSWEVRGAGESRGPFRRLRRAHAAPGERKRAFRGAGTCLK